MVQNFRAKSRRHYPSDFIAYFPFLSHCSLSSKRAARPSSCELLGRILLTAFTLHLFCQKDLYVTLLEFAPLFLPLLLLLPPTLLTLFLAPHHLLMCNPSSFRCTNIWIFQASCYTIHSLLLLLFPFGYGC